MNGPSPTHAGPRPVVVHALVAVLCLVWGSTWWAIRVSLADLPPFTAASVRFLIAGGLMALLTRALRGRESGLRPPTWLWVSTACWTFTLSYGLIYATETVVPSGIAAVLWAVFPVLMAIAGHCWLGEQLRRRHAIGFAVAFLGTATMFCGDLGGDRTAALPAALVLLLSPVASAVGTVIVKRHGSHVRSVELNRNAMLLGGVLLGAAALVCERDAPVRWSASAVAATLYLAVVGTALTFGLYFWLLRWSQASRLSLISYVTPCIALALGWAVSDGTLGSESLLGGALVVVGIALVVRKSPTPAAMSTPSAAAAKPAPEIDAAAVTKTDSRGR